MRSFPVSEGKKIATNIDYEEIAQAILIACTSIAQSNGQTVTTNEILCCEAEKNEKINS